MPSLKDLLSQLRELGVMPAEIEVPRKVYGKLTSQAEEIAEEDSEEED